ncbi:MAG: 4Fe-4S dicluster domain-containing protein [Gammaproteobacteria bacterium]|nr:4Fe-4S dicluster domain-containing protein [Gammaproteobacteria bacterium]
MTSSLVLDADLCTSCLQCEMACSAQHEGLFNPAHSRIKVFEFEHGKRSIPYTCTQCEEAWCMKACPTNAISINATLGTKVVDDDKCVGCKVCTMACPYGTINYNSSTGKVIKCDLCDGKPACVDACPTGAITYRSNV